MTSFLSRLASVAAQMRVLPHGGDTLLVPSPARLEPDRLQFALLDYLSCLEKANGTFDGLPRSQWAGCQPQLPFQLSVASSTILGAGHGLFLSSGSIQAGEVVTLYPGTKARLQMTKLFVQ